MNETLITIFVIVAAAAIIIQAGILFALFISVKKTGERVEAISHNI